MRILLAVVSLTAVWPWLSTALLAQQTAPAAGTSPPAQAEASPAAADGKKIFTSTCGFCHQDGGRHAGRGPKLSKSERSDEFMIERIKKGKVGSMPAFGAVFNDAQIGALITYIRGLDD